MIGGQCKCRAASTKGTIKEWTLSTVAYKLSSHISLFPFPCVQDLVKSEIAPSAAPTSAPSPAASVDQASGSSPSSSAVFRSKQQGPLFGAEGSSHKSEKDVQTKSEEGGFGGSERVTSSSKSSGYAGDDGSRGHTDGHTGSDAEIPHNGESDTQQQEPAEGIAGVVQSGLAGLMATAEAVATSVTSTLGITPTTPAGSQTGKAVVDVGVL
jgi:hypothetical protein